MTNSHFIPDILYCDCCKEELSVNIDGHHQPHIRVLWWAKIKTFHINCWINFAGEQYLPLESSENYICMYCDNPIHAGTDHVQIIKFTNGTIHSIKVLHNTCFKYVSPCSFWK